MESSAQISSAAADSTRIAARPAAAEATRRRRRMCLLGAELFACCTTSCEASSIEVEGSSLKGAFGRMDSHDRCNRWLLVRFPSLSSLPCFGLYAATTAMSVFHVNSRRDVSSSGQSGRGVGFGSSHRRLIATTRHSHRSVGCGHRLLR